MQPDVQAFCYIDGSVLLVRLLGDDSQCEHVSLDPDEVRAVAAVLAAASQPAA